MLFGEFFHNIDGKGRMNVPARMREDLGERFCITLWSDDCLAVFSIPEWERILFFRTHVWLSLTSRDAYSSRRISGIMPTSAKTLR